jgi:hypothetical protein
MNDLQEFASLAGRLVKTPQKSLFDRACIAGSKRTQKESPLFISETQFRE